MTVSTNPLKTGFNGAAVFVNVKDLPYGAVGDGVADDTAALTNFLASANNKICHLPAGDYRITSEIAVALSNCSFIGVPGETRIFADAGYAAIQLLDCFNVHFENIFFESTYSTATISHKSPIYSINNIAKNVRFSHCKFSMPSANGHGLFIGPRSLTTETYGYIDGLWVEDCVFEDCGHIGCTLMNRGTAADKFTAARRVFFNRNKAKNLGISGTHGFLLSLDGCGSHFTVDYNEVEKVLVCGIENTGWKNGSISYNSFSDFSRDYKPLSTSNLAGTPITGVSYVGNRTLEPAPLASLFYDMNECVVRDNFMEVDAGAAAVLIRDANKNKFSNNTWRNLNTVDGNYSALISSNTSTCKQNEFVGDTFDHDTVGAGFAAVRFTGASCSENLLINPKLALAAGGTLVDQQTSAANNLIVSSQRFDGTAWNASDCNTRNFSSDANYATTILEYSGGMLVVTDTGPVLSTGRDVTLANIEKTWIVVNSTAQTLTFKGASGTGIAVATSKTATIFWDGANMRRATADV
jgi:hypothetical protein